MVEKLKDVYFYIYLMIKFRWPLRKAKLYIKYVHKEAAMRASGEIK